MASQEKEFEDLLSEMAERRRRAYRRATIYTIIPVVVGALWLLFSVYQVYRLNQQKSLVEQQIQAAIDELNRKQNEMAAVTTALADKTQQLKDAETALTKINTGVANPKEVSKEALQNINKATQAEVVPPSRPAPTPARSPTTGAARTGFNGTNYTGRDKTVITIEVTPENTRLSVTYNLDGKAGVVRENSFSFTLDKSQHDPTRLILFFDFFSQNKDGAYKVKITASDGSAPLNLIIKEPSTQTITRAFIFDIV